MNIRVARDGRAWGVFMNGDLVEGAFVYRADAEEAARRIEFQWQQEMEAAHRLTMQLQINSVLKRMS